MGAERLLGVELFGQNQRSNPGCDSCPLSPPLVQCREPPNPAAAPTPSSDWGALSWGSFPQKASVGCRLSPAGFWVTGFHFGSWGGFEGLAATGTLAVEALHGEESVGFGREQMEVGTEAMQ